MKTSVIAAAALVMGTAVPALVVPTTAMAQEDGDTKCGADGKVYTYYSALHHWSGGFVDCRGGGNGNGNGGGNNGGGNRNANEPQDGDTKCGADGKVYRWYGALHHWSGGIMNCH